MKIKIKKYIRKYIVVACSLLFIPIFSLNAFAYSSEYLSYSWLGDATVYYGSTLSAVQDESYPTTKDSLNIYRYEYTGTSALTVNQVYFGRDLYDFLYPYDANRYMYKFVGSFVFDYSVGNFNPDTVMLDNIVIHQFSNGELVSSDNAVNLNVTKTTNLDGVVFAFNFDIPSYNTLNVLEFEFSPAGVYKSRETSRLKVTGSVVAIPIDSSADEVNAIVNAINSQTSSLGSQLGDIDSGIQQGNDLIESGTEDTQSAVSDFNEVFEDFNAELENIEEFDNSIISEFEFANEQYMTELNNFSLSASLLNAGNWLSTSMQTVYDNSSDYKMLWLVPLLLGIPLIILFVRKGSDDE